MRRTEHLGPYTFSQSSSSSSSLSLSLRFNGHIPGEHGLAGVYWIKGWWRWQMDNWSYKSCKAQVKSSSLNTQCFYQVSHSFTDKKSRTFPGPQWKIFQDLFGVRECLNIKKKTAFTYNIQSVVHCRKFCMKQNVLRYCCLFSIWTTRKMHGFQGYFSRTFQDLKL